MKETEIGKVAHYYTKLGVAIIDLTATLKVGETIHVQGATTDFEQKVESIQIEHESIDDAKSGDVIGLKIKEKVREGDIVSKK